MTQLTLLDGGMGKELRRIGAPFRQPEWSALALIEAPDMVLQAHRNFIEAGAEVVTTNNYAVVPYHMGDTLSPERIAELTSLAGRLARQAADDAAHPVRVAGSLPPLFGSYEPDAFDGERAPALYRTIIEALDPFVDVWVAETMSSTAEAAAIADAVREHGIGRPLWLAYTLPDQWVDNTIALRSGETIPQIVAAAEKAIAAGAPVEAILFNCSRPEQTSPALARLATAVDDAGLDVAIGGYANGFPDERGDGYAANEVVLERRGDMDAEDYADVVGEWVRHGATIIGGCCDTYPADISALANRFGTVHDRETESEETH